MFKLLRKLFSKKPKKENKTMAEEKDVKEKVETEEVKAEEKAAVDEKPTEKAEPKVEEKTEEKTEEKVDEKVEEKPEEKPEQSEEEIAGETEPTGNGIRIEDVVTKDYLAERLDALKAMFEAAIKENSDLKNEVSTLKSKYEDSDFGDLSKKGVMTKDPSANSSFDEYSKQFMS